MFSEETKSFAQDTADKLGVSKRTVERLVQTARDLTPEAKKTIRDAGDKIRACLKNMTDCAKSTK